MSKVIVREVKEIIPTYTISEYDKNPMFLEKRVYQGSSGKVYPHPVCEGVSDIKEDKEYNVIYLENDYILVMLMPELGGRVQRLYDKTNGYDAIYYNEVIKPALVGLAGPWISGGIEFNWPQHHRPSTFDPVEYRIVKNKDGSITVWMGEIEKMFHTKGEAGFTVYPDKAYLEINGRIYNPTDRNQTFLWWANPAVPVNEYTKSIFPPDVNVVMDHGKRAVSEFPISKSVYYKYDYAPGTDITMYKNIYVPTSYMAYHSDYDFIGNYDENKKAGVIHIADHHVSPGKKQWTWGKGDFGKAWDRNLTDENGPYIEIMAGVFTDNQPDFTYLKPYEEKTFTQYFMPYKEVGNVSNASLEAIMNVKCDDHICITIYAPKELSNGIVEILHKNEVVYSEKFNLKTTEVFKTETPFNGDINDYSVKVFNEGREVITYNIKQNYPSIPSPAKEIPEPEKVETNEQLFLSAVHLEQYRHATYSPEPYYLEGLKRDPSDIRINNGYGKYLYNKGLFEQSLKYFENAIKSSTKYNPNPYDCEPYYNYGLALEKVGRINDSYDAFYKASWDSNMQDKAFYKLACISSCMGEYEKALYFVNKSLERGNKNLKARLLKTAILRKIGNGEESIRVAKETNMFDPIDSGSLYELFIQGSVSKNEFDGIMRNDEHNYIELAISYMEYGMADEALNAFSLSDSDSPMINYYKFYLTRDKKYLLDGDKAKYDYCFPNRIEDILVLENAIKCGSERAKYYLGCLFYDRGRWEESISLWSVCADKVDIPTVYRNLALAYYNKKHDSIKAKKCMEKAFAMNENDARVFFELDVLYKVMNVSPNDRLANMEKHKDLVDKRDDLFTEYMTLLNLSGKNKEAFDNIMNHHFHPWEGGEGKISNQYRFAIMETVSDCGENKEKYLERALSYPDNLGEGKLINNFDNDVYYKLSGITKDKSKKNEYLNLATRGGLDISSAVYYNDRPPEMTYFGAKAKYELGYKDEAEKCFDYFIDYANKHFDDEIKIDYFAVSLPDFLVFDSNLNDKNKAHCLFVKSLGYLGKGNNEKAYGFAKEGLKYDSSHEGLNRIINSRYFM